MKEMASMQTKRQRNDERGNAVIEVALLAPWIFFLFLGVIDVGFYYYAAINVQNAARAAAMYTSSTIGAMTDSTTACNLVLQEVKSMPFTGGTPTNCSGTDLHVTVSAPQATGLDGIAVPMSQISVSAKTLPMFPIPGLTGQLTITRTVQMRLRDKS
jgi:Flp pilus assembly protein TadG